METLQIDVNNLTDNEREQLLSLVNKAKQSKKWRGPAGEYCIYGYGPIGKACTVTTIPQYQQMGFVGKTHGEAMYIRDQLKIYAWMTHAWLEVVGDWRPRWGSDHHAKWEYVLQNTPGGPELRSFHRSYTQSAHGFYFPTKETAEQWGEMVGHLIKDLGK